MHTSSFWRFHMMRDPRLVSIALKAPEWFKGRRYPALAPREDMLHMEEEEYLPEYQAILDRLDPRQVYEDLGETPSSYAGSRRGPSATGAWLRHGWRNT
jgi:hypothetical protein